MINLIIKYKTHLFYFFIIVLSAFRFAYLDQDIHSRMIEGLCQEDEAYYIFAGYNSYLKSTDQVSQKKKINAPTFESAFTMQTYPLVYASLSILGNNYYGARVPIVLFSLLSILLLFHTIKKILYNSFLVQTLLVFFLFSDFYFFINSRILSPQGFSIFIISLLIFVVYLKHIPINRKLFIMSFIATVAVLFFYVFNLFLIAGTGLFVLTLAIKDKKINYIFYALGGLVMGLLFFTVALSFINSSFSNLYDVIVEQNKSFNIIHEDNSILNILKSKITGFISIIATNLFRFNPILLWAYIIFVISSTKQIFNKSISNTQLFLFYIFLFLTLQSIFVSSLPYRKLVIFLPLSFTALALILQQIKQRKISRSTFISSAIISGILYLYALKINLSPIYWMADDFGYFMNIKSFYVVTILISFTLLIGGTLFIKLQKKLIYFSIILMTMIHFSMDFDYFVLQRDFTHKIALKKFSKVINNQKLTAGPAHAFSFYSTCKPQFVPISFYKQQTELLEAQLLEKLKTEDSYRIEHIYKSQEPHFVIGDTTILDNAKYLIIDKVTQKHGRYSICLLKDIE